MPRAHINVIADAIISKPFQPTEVVDTVNRLLAKARASS
jgi:hypothetical protein